MAGRAVVRWPSVFCYPHAKARRRSFQVVFQQQLHHQRRFLWTLIVVWVDPYRAESQFFVQADDSLVALPHARHNSLEALLLREFDLPFLLHQAVATSLILRQNSRTR